MFALPSLFVQDFLGLRWCCPPILRCHLEVGGDRLIDGHLLKYVCHSPLFLTCAASSRSFTGIPLFGVLDRARHICARWALSFGILFRMATKGGPLQTDSQPYGCQSRQPRVKHLACPGPAGRKLGLQVRLETSELEGAGSAPGSPASAPLLELTEQVMVQPRVKNGNTNRKQPKTWREGGVSSALLSKGALSSGETKP